ncbi:cytochrome c [Methylonatrum kenyense]|uniref:cytochrome c n=1 Tax=Methylonatrum kenyense TaxID=455253 RepID=UPI0020C016B1|nr:c-type cytochrome [Methylonatrum kenyense]MCK8515035.1 cytochrome c [Methylonatrum kenyense]
MPFRHLATSLLGLAALLLPMAGTAETDAEVIAEGKYLARAANCMGCHTARGGEDFAGGHRLGTDFGTFFTPNITPDADTGIGDWTRQEFRKAMRHGRRPDGSALYPACPYTSFTRMNDEKIDAIHAYLASLPAVRNEIREHSLSFPASARPLQRAWQRLYFDAGEFEADPERSDTWNRGAFLVRGPAHCMACHADRDRFGSARTESPRGGHVQGWYAPSLYSSREAGLQDWPEEDAVTLLRVGKSDGGVVTGPMADVVYDSLQHLGEDDIRAMVHYLQSLPDRDPEPARHQPGMTQQRYDGMLSRGSEIYENRCMDCHGRSGEGSEAAGALAGNRAVMLNDPTNVIQVIRRGGYAPSTAGNRRPFGMPPFPDLNDADIAAVATYIRRSWGNEASPVSRSTVERSR